MQEDPKRAEAAGADVRVIELNLDYSAWYWVHHPQESKRPRFWLHQGRLLLGDKKISVGVNLADVSAQSWVGQAPAEQLARIRTAKADNPDVLDLLKAFPNLEALECSSLSEDELRWVCALGHPLKLFYLSWCDDLKDTEPLAQLGGLVRLVLADCQMLNDVSGVGELTELQRLEFINCDNLWDLEPLAPLKKLSRLVIRNCDTIRKLVPLAVLDSLTSLDLSRCNQLEELLPLAKIPGLTSLDLSDCHEVRNIHPLSELDNLRELRLFGCKKLGDLRPIHRLPRLQKLSLPPAIRDDDLLGLCLSHSLLQEFDLRDCILIEGLEPIGNLQHLTHLNLGGCRNISDLTPLAKLEKLIRLDLAYCPEVEDLAPLHELKQLKELYVGGCEKLTRDQIRAFHQVAPQCEVHTV